MLDKLEEKPLITNDVAQMDNVRANEEQETQEQEVLEVQVRVQEEQEMQQLSFNEVAKECQAAASSAMYDKQTASSAICIVPVKDAGNDEEAEQTKGPGNNWQV